MQPRDRSACSIPAVVLVLTLWVHQRRKIFLTIMYIIARAMGKNWHLKVKFQLTTVNFAGAHKIERLEPLFQEFARVGTWEKFLQVQQPKEQHFTAYTYLAYTG